MRKPAPAIEMPRGTLLFAYNSGLSHWSPTDTLAVGTGTGNHFCPSGQVKNSVNAPKSLGVFKKNCRGGCWRSCIESRAQSPAAACPSFSANGE